MHCSFVILMDDCEYFIRLKAGADQTESLIRDNTLKHSIVSAANGHTLDSRSLAWKVFMSI